MKDTLPLDKIVCACGCGQFKKPDKRGQIRGIYIQGHSSRGELNNRWKGGINYAEGYRLVKKPVHPRADHRGYVREHILVIEKIIDRALAENEEVHHINGIRHDNRPENLQLITHSNHSRLTNSKDMSTRRCCDCGSDKTVGRHWYKPPESGGLWCHTCRARYRWRQKQFWMKLLNNL